MAVNIRTRSGVSDYLDSLRPIRPGGLIFGFRRPAPATPCPDGIGILQRLAAALRHGLAGGEEGVVLCSPVDVVLDEKNALVLHPSAAVVFANRCGIVQNTERLWGAPNVVVELVWSATARHTRCAKVRWYRAFGVEECWLLDTRRRRVEVLEFHGASRHVPIIYQGRDEIGSRLLRPCNLSAQHLFIDRVDGDASGAASRS